MERLSKESVHQKCIQHLEQKIKSLSSAITDVRDSANSETKSSVGDKHETARAMAQNETDRMTGQLNAHRQTLAFLKSLDPSSKHSEATSGTLIETDNGIYYLSVGIGKISVDGSTVMAISMNTPFGQAIRGKKKGEAFLVNSKKMTVINIS